MRILSLHVHVAIDYYSFVVVLFSIRIFFIVPSNQFSDIPIIVKICFKLSRQTYHYDDVIMGTSASQITSFAIVYSIVYSRADQRKHQTPRHWPLCGEFPAQMASNAENVSIWWRHHVIQVKNSIWLMPIAVGKKYVTGTIFCFLLPPTSVLSVFSVTTKYVHTIFD